MDIQKSCFGKVTPCKYGHFLVSMLNLCGVYFSTSPKKMPSRPSMIRCHSFGGFWRYWPLKVQKFWHWPVFLDSFCPMSLRVLYGFLPSTGLFCWWFLGRPQKKIQPRKLWKTLWGRLASWTSLSAGTLRALSPENMEGIVSLLPSLKQTLPLKNGCLEYYLPFGMAYFQVPC